MLSPVNLNTLNNISPFLHRIEKRSPKSFPGLRNHDKKSTHATNILALNGLRTGPGEFTGHEINFDSGLVYAPGYGYRGPYDLSYFYSPVNNYAETHYSLGPSVVIPHSDPLYHDHKLVPGNHHGNETISQHEDGYVNEHEDVHVNEHENEHENSYETNEEHSGEKGLLIIRQQ